MNIAVVSPYGEVYGKDRLFDPSACNIGENLLAPGIVLKQELEKKGHNYHTVDMYNFNEIDVIIFHDINSDSILTLSNPIDLAKYIVRKKWKRDYLSKMASRKEHIKSILIAQEPPVIFPNSYEKKYHRLFDQILTWNDDLLTEPKYHKFQYPQVKPKSFLSIPFDKKKLISMISSNKKSNAKNELYSKRFEFIQFMESKHYDFDLYGIGWQNEHLKCYKGRVEKKLEILSGYKFSLCYENMCGVKGYITEKIFDCFFAGTVPVYWGAENISDYMPSGAFIDRRHFESNEMLYKYITEMSKSEYERYISKAHEYLESDAFKKEFSVDAYISRIEKAILIG